MHLSLPIQTRRIDNRIEIRLSSGPWHTSPQALWDDIAARHPPVETQLFAGIRQLPDGSLASSGPAFRPAQAPQAKAPPITVIPPREKRAFNPREAAALFD